jgi:hypothetical protein
LKNPSESCPIGSDIDNKSHIFRRKLRAHIKSLGKRPSISEKNGLNERRRRLKARIDRFQREATIMIPFLPDDTQLLRLVPYQNYAEDVVEDEEEHAANYMEEQDIYEEEEEVEKLPETIVLMLPSALTSQDRLRLNAKHICLQEIQLWEGQANDALEALRNSLAQVSLVLRTKVRNAKSQYTKTRSWEDVEKNNVQVWKYLVTYRTARNALIQLKAPVEILYRFQEIKKEDLKMPGDIVEENRIGQRNDKIAWFWKLDASHAGDQDEWMKECEC